MVFCMRFPILAFTAMLLSPGVPLAQVPANHGAVEGQLCRAQLELLIDGEKLTPEEIARFEAQCDCLETRAGTARDTACSEGRAE